VPSLGSEYDTGTTREAQRKVPSHDCHDNAVTGGRVPRGAVVLELVSLGAEVVACVPEPAFEVLHADAARQRAAPANSDAARRRDTDRVMPGILAVPGS